MDMQVKDLLASIFPLIHHQSVPIGQTHLARNRGYAHQHVTQDHFVPVLSLCFYSGYLGYACESVSDFGDDEDMDWSLGSDVLKGIDLL
jgi:hypothetical protein